MKINSVLLGVICFISSLSSLFAQNFTAEAVFNSENVSCNGASDGKIGLESFGCRSTSGNNSCFDGVINYEFSFQFSRFIADPMICVVGMKVKTSGFPGKFRPLSRVRPFEPFPCLYRQEIPGKQ